MGRWSNSLFSRISLSLFLWCLFRKEKKNKPWTILHNYRYLDSKANKNTSISCTQKDSRICACGSSTERNEEKWISRLAWLAWILELSPTVPNIEHQDSSTFPIDRVYFTKSAWPNFLIRIYGFCYGQFCGNYLFVFFSLNKEVIFC